MRSRCWRPAPREAPRPTFWPRNLGGPVDVMIFGPDVDTERALILATGLDQLYPDIVVVLAAVSTADLALAAMRSGIRDVIAPETEAGRLRQALERAAMTSTTRKQATSEDGNQQRTRGRVISVMSPKGGVGKTTVATNLAVGLAKHAPRARSLWTSTCSSAMSLPALGCSPTTPSMTLSLEQRRPMPWF